MGDPALILKDFPTKLSSASYNDQKALFDAISNLMIESKLSQQAAKGIAKLLPNTLNRYVQTQSRSLINTFLNKIPPDYAESFFIGLLSGLKDFYKSTGHPTLSNAKVALKALKWISIVIKKLESINDDEILSFLDLNFNLSSCIVGGNEQKTIYHCKQILFQQWSEEYKVRNALLKKIQEYEILSKNLTYEIFFLGWLISKNQDTSTLKSRLLDVIIKDVINSKTKTSSVFVKNFESLLLYVSEDEFKNILLPPITKSLLRNPEIVMEAVSLIFEGLKIDLSPYLLDLTKYFKTNLLAKDDDLRENTVLAISHFLLNCKDFQAIQDFCNVIFGVLEGKEGKLTVNAQKFNLLKATCEVTKSDLDNDSLIKLGNYAVEHYIKVLETEVHEGVLIYTLDVISIWCDKCVNGISEKLISWLPKGLDLKTTTSSIRSAYLTVLYKIFKLENMEIASKSFNCLSKCLESCNKQLSQVNIIHEGILVTACLILSKEHTNDAIKYLSLCSSTLLQDRCLQPMTNNVLLALIDVSDKMIIDNEDTTNINWYKFLVIGLTNDDYEVREYCQSLCKIKLKSIPGDSFYKKLIQELIEFVFASELNISMKENKQNPSTRWSLSSKAVIHSMRIFIEQKFDYGLHLLLLSHHDIIKQDYPSFWLCIMSKQAHEWATTNFVDILQYLKGFIHDSTYHQAISHVSRTLIKVIPDEWADVSLKFMDETMIEPSISVSETEVAIYYTPDGEVYDKSVLNNGNGTDTTNIKRENKAYSYKEQMEEIALRKEIEEKRRKEGKLPKPSLTLKQKEALKAQLQLELDIRKKVGSVLEMVLPYKIIFAPSIAENPIAFEQRVPKVFKFIFIGLKNPLLKEVSIEILKNYCKGFSYFNINDGFSKITLNLLININSKKSEIPGSLLESYLTSFIDKLYELIDNPRQLLSPSTFSFCFPVVKKTLMVLKKEEYLQKGLKVMSKHCSVRGSFLSSPKYLPRTDMLILLIDLITKLPITLQQLATCVMVEIAESASGNEGCDLVSDDEIEVLLGGVQNDSISVRDGSLRCLKETVGPKFRTYTNYNFLRRLWIAKFDENEEISQIANEVWDEVGLEVDKSLALEILEDISHPSSCVRYSCALALASLLEKNVSNVQDVIGPLMEIYSSELKMTPPIKDSLGRIVTEPIDHWEARAGVAFAIGKIAPYFDQLMVQSVMSFLVPGGLSDRNEIVRKNMLDTAVTTVDLHGKDTSNELLPVFEDFLDNAPSSEGYDCVRQSVVILMGSMARHLDPESPKVRKILKQLILTLNTPSQQVQEAVAKCLPPLVPSIKSEATTLFAALIKTLLGSENSYGERKGAAYGIAGIVKGLGILSLKQCAIMSQLTEAITNKKNPTHREGALLAFEMLCTTLGRLFEPYIVHILPHLLLCFGDSVDHVRQAADDTARAVMKKLSAHGVKLVLPSLLDALEQDQWRTKTGSIELLGAMAYCAPKQLSSCLPSIVPKLIHVMGDSHHKVQTASAHALKQIGSVIRNPEIQAIVPVLLKALQDPAKKTGNCLLALLQTKFVHFIDAPSLALIMPVVKRAFQDRSTETRKMAAKIIGNMYSLTDQKDLSPYLSGVIPGLKMSLLDPVPEVRAVSARALGSMVKGIGESSFEELLPWLMSTLTSETSSVDRSGAAQGLAEVVGGLGIEKMDSLMPDIIKTAERMDIAPHVKDGYIMMFIYMPLVFPKEFRKYISQIISPILRALADENEFVRETAYKSGQRLVLTYAESAIELLLPELEKGMFEENWRIRHSSIQLLGDLLYKISGVSGKMSTETAGEDDNFGTEQSQKIIIDILGDERRNRVLAGLYMGRSDVALMVRQSSLHVWKVIVSNTPKTLREILPTLFNLLLGCLASSSYDKRQVAARTLGDLVKKLGERVLPEIIPILEDGLKSDQPEKRQGVCVGLSEIMASTSRDMVMTFVDSLVPTVKKTLCDDLPEVRVAAAKTFDSLHSTVGSRALDDILPDLLAQLDDPAMHDNTLDGLRQIIAIKSRAVLPYLIPKLISNPVNLRALASLAPVAGEALHRHLPRILPAVIASVNEVHGTPRETEELSYAQTIVLSVNDDEDDSGVSYVMEELLSACNSVSITSKKSAVTLLHSFCSQTKTDYFQYVPQLIRSLIHLFIENDDVILMEAWNTLNAVTKGLDNAELMGLVPDVRQALRFALMDNEGKELLGGFCLPKGITPVLPIFRESILNGSPALKEQAAVGLGEVIKVTSPESLKPSVVHITGPLIRILGDRFAPSVKVAVLETLATLLSRAGVMLKPFFPQLQTTFLKALNDSIRSVRLKSGLALSYLIAIHVRPDPLFNEILTGIKSADDSSIRDTYIQALRGCIVPTGGEKLTPSIRKQVLNTLTNFISSSEDTSRTVGSGCLGALCKWLSPEELASTFDGNIIVKSTNLSVLHGKSCALFVALKEAPEIVYTDERKGIIHEIALSYLSSESSDIVKNGLKCIGYILLGCFQKNEKIPMELISPFCKSMNHSSNEVKELVAILSNFLAKKNSNQMLANEFLKAIIPMLVNGTKEKNTAVKASSEFALISLLHLRDSPDNSKFMDILETDGARESLNDVINKVLPKLANKSDFGLEVLDNTILK
ncbi:LOW QUALITY PROTEIN: stalled ribosome sensor GCN1 [Lepeophtheirus salmonis]|uniref:LOW QUALITY PROTEIN: stalled ribosome sensor GCN1 n=1 Tax=Lepeophtheirus salmonis TaxID=72036 RepID=UPI001AE77956|nr:LOW QUALITY PROTEIN: eIF-2-alpha kinase activator GCN1-like [Lepeophtheirus salmonis]